MALRVTDAELKQEFLIPVGLAKTVGVFKDMVESANDRGQEPVSALRIRVFNGPDHS